MRRLAILLAVGLLAPACSSDSDTPDAGSDQSTLEVLDPPGDSIGLTFGSEIELRVRFTNEVGETGEGEPIEFELVAGANEDVAGAVLSASAAATASDGVASIFLTAGASDTNFRVRASASGAAPVFFFIAVSNSGFAAFEVATNHVGPRPEDDYLNLEFRLFDPSALRCAELDVDNLPNSVFPPRSAPGFDQEVAYRNLAAARPYTLVVWGENQLGATRLGFGCIELAAEQVMPGTGIRLTAPVADRALNFATPVAIQSTVVLADFAVALDAVVSPDPWTVVGCDLGAASLAIDCALDAAISDGTDDCVPTASDSLIDDVEALRGQLDLAGCRPDEQSPGVDSIDREILDLMVAGPWTENDAVALADARLQLLSGFALESSLSGGEGVASHSLDRIRLMGGGETFEEDLAASSRAVVASDSIEATVGTDGVLVLGDAGFTLDIERSLAGAFDTELAPAFGLGGRESDLGTALYESFGGCAAFSSAVCTRVSRAANCIEAACNAAATNLDGHLRAWLGAASATGIDFTISGSAAIEDRDFDLAVDTVGGGADRNGAWSLTIDTAGTPVTGVGVFGN